MKYPREVQAIPGQLNVNALTGTIQNFSQVGIGGDVTGGSAKLYVNGNVGIGTTAPGQKLTVADTLAITNTGGWQTFLMGNQDSAGVNNPFVMASANGNLYMGHGNSWAGSGGTRTDILTVLNNGNVGIGTTTPDAKLRVEGLVSVNGEGNGVLVDSGTAAAARVGLMKYGGYEGMLIAGNATLLRLGHRTDTTAVYGGTPTIRADLVIDSGGNVGIGTTGPAEKLDVNGSIKVATNGRVEVNRGRLGFSGSMGDWNHVIYNDYNNIDGEGSWDGMKMNVYAGLNVRVDGAHTSALYVQSGGNVGIGTTGPNARLTVGTGNQIQLVDNPSGWGSYGQVPNIVINNTFDNPLSNDGWGYKQISFMQQNGSEVWSQGWSSAGLKFTVNGNSSLFLKKDGNVGIGTAAPASKLSVNGTGFTNVAVSIKGSGSGPDTYGLYVQAADASLNFYIKDSGPGYLRAAAWSYGSDRRLKENIVNLENGGLDKIMQLKPVSFDYINGVKNNLGFIAQDVQTVIPQAVSIADPKTGILGLKTDFIIPYLVKGMQEQQSEIVSLQSRIDSQQKQINELKIFIKELKNK